MELSRTIIGPVLTEKAERMKAARSYTLHVDLSATKIDVKSALEKFFDVEVQSVRVLRTRKKVRDIGAGNVMTKRSASKRMMVTLTKKSKSLDLAQFRTA